MTYAPHTNLDHKNALDKSKYPLILGQFREKEFGKLFEYVERNPDDGFEKFACPTKFPHMIYVGPHQERRFANVKQTVAYIVTDEDDFGAIAEKWEIKSHKKYDNSWIGR